MSVEQNIEMIMDFMFHNHGEDAELKIGVWNESEEPHTFYAVICEARSGNVILGESSYGTDTVDEALKELTDEMADEAKDPDGNQGQAKNHNK